MLTHGRLRELLNYDPENGEFRWIKRGHCNIKVGSIAGTRHRQGYCVVYIDGKIRRAHRLAWLWVHGRWPSGDLDHINGDPADNRIANLRECTRSQNAANSKCHKNNRSGVKGISWHSAGRKWVASIGVEGKNIYLGLFDTKEEAAAAYARGAQEHFGQFARI